MMESFLFEGANGNASNENGTPMQLDAEVCKQDNEVSLDHDAHLQAPINWDIDQFPDLSENFTTDQIFESRQDLIDWVNNTGIGCGTVVSTSKSDAPTSKRRSPRLHLSCVERNNKKVVTKCPFQLRGVYIRGSNGKWKLMVHCGRHNHQLGDTFQGYRYARKLKPEGNKLVRKSTTRTVKLKLKPEANKLVRKLTTRTVNLKHVVKKESEATKRVRFINTRRRLAEVSIKQFWKVIRPFIDNVHNVPSDGHCGFRAVAAGLEKDSLSGWLTVREELIAELDSFEEEYRKIYGDEDDVKRLRNALSCTESPCPPNCWFTLPTMGHLVASKYGVVFVYISHEEALTFVPLRSPPPIGEPKVIAIGHVDRAHFVPIKLNPGCPIPRPIKVWVSHNLAARWGGALKKRNDAFEAIVCQQRSAQAEPILID